MNKLEAGKCIIYIIGWLDGSHSTNATADEKIPIAERLMNKLEAVLKN